jgi:hypothetical protein
LLGGAMPWRNRFAVCPTAARLARLQMMRAKFVTAISKVRPPVQRSGPLTSF